MGPGGSRPMSKAFDAAKTLHQQLAICSQLKVPQHTIVVAPLTEADRSRRLSSQAKRVTHGHKPATRNQPIDL
ncbi:hypothetical protein OPT61_g8032 [Boeremia exigua]|uniref:Uncharacterized protein n=1 Tax=Boeremia exigua TaxID=749465 RepID=A0ACC2I099_9PLEO|nr:hypothetical protein OPT61_g8032 [Boeremia exigua]